MKSLIDKVTSIVMEQVPASVAPENQYAKSLAATLCLLVAADKVFDAKEFADAALFIESDEVLRKADLTQRATHYFTTYCSRIEPLMTTDNVTEFPAMQTELVGEVRNCKGHLRLKLKEVINDLKSGCDETELNVINRIQL